MFLQVLEGIQCQLRGYAQPTSRLLAEEAKWRASYLFLFGDFKLAFFPVLFALKILLPMIGKFVVHELFAVVCKEGILELLLVLLVEELGEGGGEGGRREGGERQAGEALQKAPGSHSYKHLINNDN
jgi:hypothetical protein